MKPVKQYILRPFVWLRRFRKRCGYGVHSPFAFNLITNVIYERAEYVKYKELLAEEKRMKPQKGAEWTYESLKDKRMLFRLVNRVQPVSIVDVGTLSASELYLRAAKVDAPYYSYSAMPLNYLPDKVGFLLIHKYDDAEFVEKVFNLCVARTTPQSLFVIEGICYNEAMRRLWKRMKQHAAVGITFDLYDYGLLFFDRTKIQQHYVVNY